METRANYVLIGLFALATIVGAFGFVYWLARYSDGGERDQVAIVFNGAVTGLAKGSQVMFNGIKVGEVSSLYLDPANPAIVRATASIDRGLPLRRDTKAQIETQGFAGAAYLQLSGGSAEAPALLAPEGGVPEIVATGSSFQDLIEGARQVLTQANTVFGRIDDVLVKNEPVITEALANARDITETLKGSAGRIDEVITSVAEFSDTFKQISARVTGLIDNVDKVVLSVDTGALQNTLKNVETFSGTLAENSGRVNEIAKGAQELVGRMNGMAARLDGVVGKVDGLVDSDGKGFIAEATEAARNFRRMSAELESRIGPIAANIERFSGNGLRNVDSLVADGRRTLANFDRVITSLERNPSQFLLGGNRAQEYSPRR